MLDGTGMRACVAGYESFFSRLLRLVSLWAMLDKMYEEMCFLLHSLRTDIPQIN